MGFIDTVVLRKRDGDGEVNPRHFVPYHNDFCRDTDTFAANNRQLDVE